MMCASASQMTSCPGCVWVRTATWLPIVPEATKRPASFPNRSAARASRRWTVGASSQTSSPTSAAAIAARISGVGVVRGSERRSTMSCMQRLLGGERRLLLASPAGPLAARKLLDQPAERAVGFLGALEAEQRLGLLEESLGGGRRAAVLLEDHVVTLDRGLPVALPDVVVGDPQLLLGQPQAAGLDLHDRVRRVAALGVLLDELLELGDRPGGRRLVALDGRHVVEVAPGQAVLDQVGDRVTRVETHEAFQLLDRLGVLPLPVVGLAEIGRAS